MDILSTLGFSMGSAWLSGVNLYAAVLTMGLLQRFHLVQLPGDLARTSEWWVIGLAAALFLVQFIADKIPAVDSAWDMVHTFIRIPAGAILAASAFAHFDPMVKLAAFLVGGSVALSSHGAKTATRLAANTSPEPFSNMALSFIGDGVTFASTLLMAFFPVLMLIAVIIFVGLSIWLVPKIYRAMRKLFRRGDDVPAQTASA